jgi:glucose-1-phosphate thymidylyltransferase
VTIHDPVYIEEGVTIERSEIGPNVSLEQGTTVRDCRLEHTLVGAGSVIQDSTLHHSMLGDRVTVRGFQGTASLGADSELVGGD